MPGRSKSRERALQVLFSCDMRKLEVSEALDAFYSTLYSSEDLPESRLERDRFMEALVYGTIDKQAAIDETIGKHSQNWRLERMPSVDRNILRMATYELMRGESATAIVIDEAIELARRFSGDESLGFINGVLDAVAKAIEADQPAHRPTGSGAK
jgi:N utilization substance protein B